MSAKTDTKLPGWITSRADKGKPLLTPYERKGISTQFEKLLDRITKPTEHEYYRHPERIEIIRRIVMLNPGDMFIRCLYACVVNLDDWQYSNRDARFAKAIRILRDEETDEYIDPAHEELDRFFANLEQDFNE